MNRIGGFVIAWIGFGVLAAAPAHAVDNGFLSNAQGWSLANVAPEAHIATNPATIPAIWDGGDGSPAGSIRTTDVYSWTYFGAPASHLGDYSASYGGMIRYDLLIRYTDATPWPAFALRGKNITLYHVTAPPPDLNTWSTIIAPLTGAAWRVDNWQTGAVATNAQMLSVLSDVRGIYVLAEWHTGIDDSNVDNFFMTGTPGPVCTGDITGDGFVNTADFNIFAGNFGTSVPPNTLGDLTGDGLVNTADFNLLAGDFGCGS